MFQYAFYVALSKHSGDECLVDTTAFDQMDIHNGYELDRVFGLSPAVANVHQIKKLTWYTKNHNLRRFLTLYFPKRTMVVEKHLYEYVPDVLDRVDDSYYDGYWQFHAYFDNYRDILKSDFQFKAFADDKNIDLYEQIKEGGDFVSVHVRRGDYLESELYRGLCGIDYYSRAIDFIKKNVPNVSFLFFSNDIQWCKSNLLPLLGNSKYQFVDWNKGNESYRDMQLMSYCKYNIIANSSFSWWAAYLNSNREKIVIAPEKWINRDVDFCIHMPEWIKL